MELSGVDAPYGKQLVFDYNEVIGTGESGSVGFRLDHFVSASSLTLKNSPAGGFSFGYNVTPESVAGIANVNYLNNTIDQQVQPPVSDEFGDDLLVE